MDESWRYLAGIDHRFIGSYILAEVPLMYAAKWPQIGAQRCTAAFTCVAVNLAATVPIVVARPFVRAMTDRPMLGMRVGIAGQFISVEPNRAAAWHVL